MLLAAAVCPHPPLLVPEVAAGAAAETEDLRNACRAAVATLAAYDVVVVGAAPETRWYDGAVDLSGYGLGTPSGDALPLALAVGRWLAPHARLHGIVPRTPPDDAAALGADLAREDVAMLVMGDASARRDPKAPGYVDPRAQPYDAAVAAALRDADPAALLALDPADDDGLLVAGRAAWQVLAGAAGAQRFRGTLTYDDAPYGVGYLVAAWSRA